MSKKKRMIIKSFEELSKKCNFHTKEEEPPVLNARIIEYPPEKVKEMEMKEKERKFWFKMIKGTGLGGKKGHDN